MSEFRSHFRPARRHQDRELPGIHYFDRSKFAPPPAHINKPNLPIPLNNTQYDSSDFVPREKVCDIQKHTAENSPKNSP